MGDDANVRARRARSLRRLGRNSGRGDLHAATMAVHRRGRRTCQEITEKTSTLETQASPRPTAARRRRSARTCARLMSYGHDPPMRQTCFRPQVTAVRRVRSCCVKRELRQHDCALGALLRAAGLDVKVLGIEYGGGAQDHVNISGEADDEGNRWVEVDCDHTTPGGLRVSGRKLHHDPLNPAVTGAGVAGGAFWAQDDQRGRWPFSPLARPSSAAPSAPASSPPATSWRTGRRGTSTSPTPVGWRSTAARCFRTAGGQRDASTRSARSTSPTATTCSRSGTSGPPCRAAAWCCRARRCCRTSSRRVLECGARARDAQSRGPVPCSLSYVNPQGAVVAAAPGADPSLQVQIIARIERTRAARLGDLADPRAGRGRRPGGGRQRDAVRGEACGQHGIVDLEPVDVGHRGHAAGRHGRGGRVQRRQGRAPGWSGRADGRGAKVASSRQA